MTKPSEGAQGAGVRPMRILLVTHFFPPYDHIASARTGKTAKYLERFGHDVRVIAARNPVTPFAVMPVEIPRDHVIYTRWISGAFRLDIALNKLAQNLAGTRRAETGSRADPQSGNAPNGEHLRARAVGVGKRIRDGLRAIFYFPDAEIGWLPFAERAGRKLLRRWQPDVIVASSGPPTALLIANHLASRHGLPWVAEFRDLWTDNHLYPHPQWRRRIERQLEVGVVSRAAGLITVSEPLADRLRRNYVVPVEVVYNGFDPGDYGDGPTGPVDHRLTIVYTGWLYEQQDPTPLFEALGSFGTGAKNVRLIFYRSDHLRVHRLARKYGVDDLVETRAGVSFMDSLLAQRTADVLLHVSWNDPLESGIFSGKLMQYLGARRPILSVGDTSSAPARLIAERGLGVALADGKEIALVLRNWLLEKRAGRAIPEIPPDAASEFSRESQTRILERFLARIVDAGPNTEK